MVQAARRSALLPKTLQRVLGAEVAERAEDLDRHLTLQLQVRGAIHDAKASKADPPVEAILAVENEAARQVRRVCIDRLIGRLLLLEVFKLLGNLRLFALEILKLAAVADVHLDAHQQLFELE